MIQDSVSVPGVTNPFGMGYLFNPYAAYAANGAAQLVSTATSQSWLCLGKMSGNTNAQTSLNWPISFKFTKLSSFCGETKLDWRAFVLIYEKISPILCKFQSGIWSETNQKRFRHFFFYSRKNVGTVTVQSQPINPTSVNLYDRVPRMLKHMFTSPNFHDTQFLYFIVSYYCCYNFYWSVIEMWYKFLHF